MKKPMTNEYNPYFQRYIDLTGDGNFEEMFRKNGADTITYFSNLPADKHEFRYEPGKWTIKETLMHLIDTERVFAYRALVAGRADSETPLHKMDPDQYIKGQDVSGRPLESIVKEFATVRAATEVLFDNMTEEQNQRTGNNIAFPITPRALGYIMMGHILHHINIINERYFV